MLRRLVLREHGIRLFAGRLYNHDYLWFSSYEISKVSTTLPVIHNYALSYALSSYSHGVYLGSIPRYQDDLAEMPLYATPAEDIYAKKTAITYNAVDALTLRTDTGGKINTPDLGRRVYLDPVYEDPACSNLQQGYRFYVFVYNGRKPCSVTRLGKKGCPARIKWAEIENPVAVFKNEPVRPTHILNPLDIEGEVISYEPIAIPPHLLFREATLRDSWFVFQGRHVVHLPKRVREKITDENNSI